MRLRRIHQQGMTLVEIMIVLAVMLILMAISLPGVIRVKMTANDTLAKATLKTLSSASEGYAGSNSSVYPASEAALMSAAPPYLSKTYCGMSINGFDYTCSFSTSGYTIIATPVSLGSTGTTTYTITTGGVLTPST